LNWLTKNRLATAKFNMFRTSQLSWVLFSANPLTSTKLFDIALSHYVFSVSGLFDNKYIDF